MSSLIPLESQHQDVVNERCTYRNCRHADLQHGKTWKKANGKRTGCKCKHFTPPERSQRKDVIQRTETLVKLESILNNQRVLCRWCEEQLSSYDIEQDGNLGEAGDPWTYVHCPSCKYDWAAWKIFNQVEKVELVSQ